MPGKDPDDVRPRMSTGSQHGGSILAETAQALFNGVNREAGV